MATVMCATWREVKIVTVKTTPNHRAVRTAKIPKYHVINYRLLLYIYSLISFQDTSNNLKDQRILCYLICICLEITILP